MKLEKINENQIRCTLTREDLEMHQVNLRELAYGSEKAKKLFRDMMQQAQIEFGFEADNIPLMIEAIPVNLDSIILIITKVEDPEELDTRFSRFSPYKDSAQTEPLQLDGADNIIDIFQKICESRLKNKSSNTEGSKESDEAASDSSEKPAVNLIRQYTFTHLDDVIAASHGLNGFSPAEIPYTRLLLTKAISLSFTSLPALRRSSIKSAIFFLNMVKEVPVHLPGRLI